MATVESKRLIIMPLTPGEHHEAAEVYNSSRRFLVDISGEKPESLGLELVERELAEAAEHQAFFYGVRRKSDRRMVGVTVYQPAGYNGDPAKAWIALLMFAEPYQRLGYGREALSLIEDAIFANPTVACIRLAVLVNNPDGQVFWQKTGYRVLLLRKHLKEGPEVIVMEKPRTPEVSLTARPWA